MIYFRMYEPKTCIPPDLGLAKPKPSKVLPAGQRVPSDDLLAWAYGVSGLDPKMIQPGDRNGRDFD